MDASNVVRNTTYRSNESVKSAHGKITRLFLEEKNASSINLSFSQIKIPLLRPLWMLDFVKFIHLIQTIDSSKFLPH